MVRVVVSLTSDPKPGHDGGREVVEARAHIIDRAGARRPLSARVGSLWYGPKRGFASEAPPIESQNPNQYSVRRGRLPDDAVLTVLGDVTGEDSEASTNTLHHDLLLQEVPDGHVERRLPGDPRVLAALRLALEERSQLSPRAAAGLTAEYHDVFQPWGCPVSLVPDDQGRPIAVRDTSCHRDFRLGAARATVSLQDEQLGLGADVGLRGYEWKPDEDLSFFGLGTGLAPSLRLRQRASRGAGADDDDAPDDAIWTLQAMGRLEWRRYGGATDPQQPGGDHRADLVGSVGLQLAYAGPLLASAGYLYEASSTNSVTGGYAYHMVSLSLTVPMPAKIVAAMRAQLLFFARGSLPTSLSVEEESRDAVILDLARELGAGFTARVRYSVFRNAASDLGGGYLRQLVFVGASWEMR